MKSNNFFWKKKINLELYFFSKTFLNKIYVWNRNFYVFKKLYNAQLANKKRKQKKYYKAKQNYYWYYTNKDDMVQFKAPVNFKKYRHIKRSFTYVRLRRYRMNSNLIQFDTLRPKKYRRKYIIWKKEGYYKGRRLYLIKRPKYLTAQRKYARHLLRRDYGYGLKHVPAEPKVKGFKLGKRTPRSGRLKRYLHKVVTRRGRYWYKRRKRSNLKKVIRPMLRGFKVIKSNSVRKFFVKKIVVPRDKRRRRIKFIFKKKPIFPKKFWFKKKYLRSKRNVLSKNFVFLKLFASFFKQKAIFSKKKYFLKLKKFKSFSSKLTLFEKNNRKIHKFFKVSKSFSYFSILNLYLKMSFLSCQPFKHKNFLQFSSSLLFLKKHLAMVLI